MATSNELAAKEAKAEKLINPDPFCEVRLQQIENRGKRTDKFMIELQQPETGEFVEVPGVGSVHSVNYKLITNKQVHDMAQQVLHTSGLTFEPVPTFGSGHSKPIYWNGRRFAEKWFCQNTAIDVPGGSSMMLGMELMNSYDGSSKVGLSFFAMHVACANQFYSNNMLGEFAFPHANHGGNLNDDIEETMNTIKGQAANFAKIGPNMKLLNDTRVPSFAGFLGLRAALRDETGCEFRDKQVLDELTGCGITTELKMKDVKHSDPGSYWAISNAYTAVTTHCVGGARGTAQSSEAVDWLLRAAISKRAFVN